MDEPVEDGVGEGRFADVIVPGLDRELAGDEGGFAAMAVVEDLEQIAPGIVVEGDQSEVVDQDQIGPGEAAQELQVAAVLRTDGALTIPTRGVGGDWIVKLPARTMDSVPENEFTMMTVAGEVGISVPEVRLVALGAVTGLPEEMGEWTEHGLAVRRFDRREGGVRVHMEDFAQVFGQFPESKYENHSYANIAAALAIMTADGRDEAMAFVRRAVFSALIGNGDAHLKNRSVLYDDPTRPTLAPAYDLVSTIPYLPRDRLALGFGGSKDIRSLDDRRIKRFARAAQLPFEAVRLECLETAERTMDAWGRHEQRDMLPKKLDEAISRHLKSVALDISRSMTSRRRER